MQPMDETRYQKVYQDGVATGSKPDKADPRFRFFHGRSSSRMASRPGNQSALAAV